MSQAATRPGEAAESGDRSAGGQLAIHKGEDGEIELGGLRFVACRREIEGIDGGVTLNVRAPVAGEPRDLVRFDFFRKRPHFHVPADEPAERTIDASRHGDGLEWGLEQIATRMPAWLDEAGFGEIAGRVDTEALRDGAGDLRRLVEGLAEPSETSWFDVGADVMERLAGD